MPRTTDAPTDADLDRLIDGARAAWGRAGDHYPASLDGFSYEAAVREADEAHQTIAALVGALVALRAELAEARPVVAAAEAHRAAYVAWHNWRPAAGMGHGHADRYAETRDALLAALAARAVAEKGGRGDDTTTIHRR